ncbi:predicted protein [Chaetoceros tenuissimus]|uniref:MYND-type domain-containing protein n=1 Tax=Chaetoceros tenuissimus TaxID=426638 RepID=A0AAD3CLT1_9STRA|nr:predicted protein [Chaetoceros tenuissimus]
MLWSETAHKYRECIEIVQEMQDTILENTGSIDSQILKQKAVYYVGLISVDYSRCSFDDVIQIYNDIQMLPEKEKKVLSLGFMSELYGQLAMLRLDGSKENKRRVVSLIDTRISEKMHDTSMVAKALELVMILRNMKEYDAAIALGEKLERLTENEERAFSEISMADMVIFENVVSNLERYRVEYHQQQIGKDFCKYFLDRVQVVFNKFDDVPGEIVLCQRDAYFMTIAQCDFLCHQVDDKELSANLCNSAIDYVERYLERNLYFGRRCFTCNQTGTATEVQLVCSGCRVACYCSLDHQRMTWKKDAVRGMRIGHEILCPLMKAYRKWKLIANKKGNERALKLRRRLDRECLYFLSHGLGLKGKCFQKKDIPVYEFY